MKAKLLHGIVKDLMKFPIGEKKHAGMAPPVPAKGAVQITVHAGKPEVEEGEELETGDGEIPGDGMEGGQKSPLMEKAIHAKMKGKLI